MTRIRDDLRERLSRPLEPELSTLARLRAAEAELSSARLAWSLDVTGDAPSGPPLAPREALRNRLFGGM